MCSNYQVEKINSWEAKPEGFPVTSPRVKPLGINIACDVNPGWFNTHYSKVKYVFESSFDAVRRRETVNNSLPPVLPVAIYITALRAIVG